MSVAEISRLAYLTRKLDLKDRELALREKELAIQERLLDHKIAEQKRQDEQHQEMHESLNALRSLAGMGSDDDAPMPSRRKAGRA
jgi:hypothetical protein